MMTSQNNYNDKRLFQLKERHIATVSDRICYGKDMQADDKYLVLAPGHWSEYDPFLLMAEDWFSANGFDWHPPSWNRNYHSSAGGRIRTS
jgi:hypothetical protein